MDKKFIYEGNVEITKENQKEWEQKLKKIKHITGGLSIYPNATLQADALESVGGDLYINSKLEAKFEKRLWKNNRNNQWYLTDQCSEFLLSCKGKIKYSISNIFFEKDLFDKIRQDKLSAEEVFAIENIEQRRVAYEKMDKTKMKALSNFKIIDQCLDKYNNPVQLLSFSVKGYDLPFKFLYCVCPSTKREYFLETQKDNCVEAKMASFGLGKEIKFNEEF